MHYVSLIVEFLRGRPAVVFWTAALGQAVLWTIVPSLFFSSPPGDVAALLAVGHEFLLGSSFGPPLAFWAGELAFRAAGMFGVYLLAQICVVIALWAVFDLGRQIVGTRHSALAILLTTGVTVFNFFSTDFGPAVLAAPLWALALNHYWRAVGEDGRGYWYLLALDVALLLLTTYAGIVLLALLVLYSLATSRGRQALRAAEPWLAALLFVIVIAPHAGWLWSRHADIVAGLISAPPEQVLSSPAVQWFGGLVLSHAGLMALVVLASGWRAPYLERVPEITRNPASRSSKIFVYFFAAAPIVVVVGLMVWFGAIEPLSRFAPFALLSGLVVIVAAGDSILLYRERAVSFTWLGLLLAPPILVVLSMAVLPWVFAADLRIVQPSSAMGRFFADSFQRRTGKPLAIIGGDEQLARLIALSVPSRPDVFAPQADRRQSPVDAAQLRSTGGILVWPASETSNAPPESLKAQFPELAPEVPRAFARNIQGRLPLVRVGWALIRPQAEGAR